MGGNYAPCLSVLQFAYFRIFAILQFVAAFLGFFFPSRKPAPLRNFTHNCTQLRNFVELFSKKIFWGDGGKLRGIPLFSDSPTTKFCAFHTPFHLYEQFFLQLFCVFSFVCVFFFLHIAFASTWVHVFAPPPT